MAQITVAQRRQGRMIALGLALVALTIEIITALLGHPSPIHTWAVILSLVFAFSAPFSSR